MDAQSDSEGFCVAMGKRMPTTRSKGTGVKSYHPPTRWWAVELANFALQFLFIECGKGWSQYWWGVRFVWKGNEKFRMKVVKAKRSR